MQVVQQKAPTLNQSAPVLQNHITGVIQATPGSNGFATLEQPTPAAIPVTSVASGDSGGYGGSSSTNTSSAPSAPPITPVSQATIDAIMHSIANSVAQNQQDFERASASNANDDAQAGIDHGNQVHTNTESRATAVQNAEQAAASGNQGLRAVLASLGALNGTGQQLAGRAVADSANNDIGGADQTFQNNATAIENANNTYTNAAHDRDATLAAHLRVDNQGANATGIQSILNDANSQNDTATYNRFLPQLVQATAPSAPIAATHSTFNPATVNSFAPTSKLNVTNAPVTNSAAASSSSTTPVNSALYVKKTS